MYEYILVYSRPVPQAFDIYRWACKYYNNKYINYNRRFCLVRAVEQINYTRFVTMPPHRTETYYEYVYICCTTSNGIYFRA